jgi:endoglucanase
MRDAQGTIGGIKRKKEETMKTLAFTCAAFVGGATIALSNSAFAALGPKTQFFIPEPDHNAVTQIESLGVQALEAALKGQASQAKTLLNDAALVTDMIAHPQAVWLDGGTPAAAEKTVQQTVREATLVGRVPTFAVYNIPYRDCGQYSAGGALDLPSYEAWIDAVAAGIGTAQAVIVLEPDSLGTIPYYGGWCQPTITNASGNTVVDPNATAANRFAELNYAVSSFAANAPNALVYLDATHSAWLNVGDAATRLVLAGVANAAGFFLNVSNFQYTANEIQYGTWISECIATANAWGGTENCPNQYWNGGPPNWTGVAMNNFGLWSDTATESDLNTSEINLRYQQALAGAAPTTHFIIDTSRNANGPLNGANYTAPPHNQAANASALTTGNWCNPPGAGLGVRPTANTGNALVDAFLWVKTPGQSDGQCDIAGGARAWDYSQYNPWNVSAANQSTFDPLWGQVDPAAGVWFPAQALQLAQNASPNLL